MREQSKSFQQLADEAFTDLLKKHKQPVGIVAALKDSVGTIRQTKVEEESAKDRPPYSSMNVLISHHRFSAVRPPRRAVSSASVRYFRRRLGGISMKRGLVRPISRANALRSLMAEE
jgi:hypothetical protein